MDRFEIVKTEEKIGYHNGKMVIEIVRDKQTGVCYLFTTYGAGSSVTPLIDSEGKPIIYKLGGI